MDIFYILSLFFICVLASKYIGLFSILPWYYFIVQCYTYIGTDIYTFAQDVPFDFYSELSISSLSQTYYLFFISAFSFALSSYISKLTFNAPVMISSNKNKKINLSQQKINIFIFICYLLTLVFLHLGTGIDFLYAREGYAGSTGDSTSRTIYTILLPFTSLLIPFLKNRFLRISLILILLAITQGTSSRNIILIPAFYFVGTVFRDQQIKYIKLLLCGFTSVFLLVFSLQYRDNTYQGVIPNIEFFLNNGVDFDYLFMAVNYITSFSFYSVALSFQSFDFNLHSFIESVTPLPSSYISVDHMMDYQKLNIFAPMPALGFLSTGGSLYIIAYYSIIGFLLPLIFKILNGNNMITPLLFSILFFIFTFLSIQYNLRAVTRVIYYLVLISIFYYFFIKLKKIKRNISY